MPTPDEHDIILEFIQQGNAIKVTAIDPKTLTEVVVMGPLKATKEEMTQLALRKLQYRIEKDTKPHG